MVGGVEQLHGTGVEDIGFGCTKSRADDGRTLVEIRSSINIDIARSIVGQMNERVERNGLGHCPGAFASRGGERQFTSGSSAIILGPGGLSAAVGLILETSIWA
jgi:hypothetical protein